MDYMEYTQFIKELTSQYRSYDDIFGAKCRRCNMDIKKYWWFSLQIANREFWFYCSTDCMKTHGHAANNEFKLNLIKESFN
ncbi:Hypothetical protein PACV_320 [Pacmanvirus A23]|uniref:Hypothetical protein n=1 Tax=Pacmanvirus A23 TaxID=1932881 RepID=UPI000A0958AA|nr:Hypothetical protein B9W72_gp316 [Pacmanvirus A23]SIP86033.1 Hypothetical protein PACV_320 [Pacmanvirus A23]